MKFPKWLKKVLGVAEKVAEPFVPPAFRDAENYLVHQVLQIPDITLTLKRKPKKSKIILSK